MLKLKQKVEKLSFKGRVEAVICYKLVFGIGKRL
jgi:hypothetical protein